MERRGFLGRALAAIGGAAAAVATRDTEGGTAGRTLAADVRPRAAVPQPTYSGATRFSYDGWTWTYLHDRGEWVTCIREARSHNIGSCYDYALPTGSGPIYRQITLAEFQRMLGAGELRAYGLTDVRARRMAKAVALLLP